VGFSPGEEEVMAPKRPVMGIIALVARFLGWFLVVLAILGLPQMRFLTGRLEGTFRLLSSIALVFAGIAWLVVIELFLRFFDQYLSRN
jgi:hypothetical protein